MHCQLNREVELGLHIACTTKQKAASDSGSVVLAMSAFVYRLGAPQREAHKATAAAGRAAAPCSGCGCSCSLQCRERQRVYQNRRVRAKNIDGQRLCPLVLHRCRPQDCNHSQECKTDGHSPLPQIVLGTQSCHGFCLSCCCKLLLCCGSAWVTVT